MIGKICLFLLIPSLCYAGTVSRHTTYATNSQVTATNLNGNIDNILQEVNSGLDNNNADTAGGFRFVEVLSSLPSAGTQGRVVFLTSDNTLNFDSGSAWTKTVISSGTPSQGDVVYYNGTAWARLGAGTNGQHLVTQGASANPAWSSVISATSGTLTGITNFAVTYTTVNTGFNADMLDGSHASTITGSAIIPIADASGYLPDNSVDTSALKTVTGEVSTASASMVNLVLPGGTYGFYPQTKASAGGGTEQAYVAADSDWGTSYTTRIGMAALTGGVTAYAQQRYVTSSGEDYWMFLLLDKVTKEILQTYSASDHPAYGNGGDFNKVPHPFINYDETIHEIILVDQETIAELKAQVTEEKSLLTLVNELYKPDMSKEEIYKPLHSGKFIDENGHHIKQMVEEIPSYIKVRKLIKMSQGELNAKTAKQEQAKQKKEQDRVKKEQDKISAKNKLKALGLTKEEIEALN